ncbi:hypothetical protein BGW38_002534, partial [Lunasporangiospora selenospora]
QLDLLSIGEDHVFIINRSLLLQDIEDYLSGSTEGLQRVFVNVDYHLPNPEIMPNNRYLALENYIRNVLLPNIQLRIKSWDQAEQQYPPLAVPNHLSLVALTGWLLSYPISYVLPGPGQKFGSRDTDSRNGQSYNGMDQDDYDDVDTEDYQDSGRNSLANQTLVVTRVHLEPSMRIEGMTEHCLLSFSYPEELAERLSDGRPPSPSSPLTPTEDDVMPGEFPEDPSAFQRSQSPKLPNSDSFDANRPLPFRNPDICAAGRSFLTQLHARFQNQDIWKTWKVGQQTVVLPVVAM